MAPRTVYANLQDGLQNLSLWDASLADMGKLGITPCTAAGTNAIILTAITAAFAPTVSSPPQQLQQFSFVAAATSTSSVTINGLKLYKEDGVTQAAANDVLINVLYGVVYNSALNGAAGGYQIAFPITSIINPVISGATITNSTFNGNTWTTGTGTLTIAAGKTETFNNTLTFAGTDGTTLTFPTTSATIARTDAGQTFTGTNAFGVLTATTVNAVTITAPATAATLTLQNNTTVTGPAASGTIATLGNAETISGVKTFNDGTVLLAGSSSGTTTVKASATASGTLTLPATTDTVVGKATTDVLTNKTLDSAGTGNVLKVSGVTVSAGQYPGETTTGSATAGNVGEYIESIVASGSATSLTTSTAKTVTSISLTAGDWDVTGNIGFIPNSNTGVIYTYAGISLATNALDTTAGRTVGHYISATGLVTTGTQIFESMNTVRVSVSSTTSVFLIAQASFVTNTMTAYGIIRARRAR